MRKVVYLSLLSALLLAVFCSGCSMFVRTPVVTVRDLRVVALDGAGAGMELNLTVLNRNPYDVKLLGYSYDLKVMTLPLAKGGGSEEVSFPAGAATDLRIPVRVSYGDLLEIFRQKLDPDKVPYALLASLDLDTPLGKLSVPVNSSGSYAVPKQYRPGSLLNRLGDFLTQNR